MRGTCLTGNQVDHYGYGFQLGCSGTCRHEDRHRVEGNVIAHPFSDGIHLKQARCLVRGNRIEGATRFALSARAGFASRFADNHLIDCQHGIRILGPDHEVVGNTVERSRLYGLLLAPARSNGDGPSATNVLVENNRFIDCGGCDPDGLIPGPGAVILDDGITPQRIGGNHVEGGAALRAVLPPVWV